MRELYTMILAGGRGERLLPLTQHRTKPAVPFGGKYRIIDITLSNCLNSGLRKIAVLIQYKSHSLDRHIRTGWSVFNPEHDRQRFPVTEDGVVVVVPADSTTK
jgi:glucose-1-phosphate adenylyltransferase